MQKSACELLQSAHVVQQNGQPDEAAVCLKKVLKQDPTHFEALQSMGILLYQQGDLAAAEKYFKKASKVKPGNPELLNNLAVVMKKQGRLTEALGIYQQALSLRPKSHDLLNNIGNVYKGLGQHDLAKEFFARALAQKSDFVAALNNLGNILRQEGDFSGAIDLYEKALAQQADDSPTLNNLGLVFLAQGALHKAEASFLQALKLQPHYPEAHNNLANVLKEQGLGDAAQAHYLEAVKAKPDFVKAHSNYLLALNYDWYDKKDVFTAHKNWARQHLGRQEKRQGMPKVAGSGKIRLGFVSPDLKRHPVACFIEPVLQNLDRDRFELFCYANLAREDQISQRLKGLAHWRNIFSLSDHDAAQCIKEDRIDILIDLAGHTQGNRLLLFGKRPAPIQAGWIGYPNTTGMAAMDYRLTDSLADPDGADEFYVETLVRLPHGFLCYRPPVPELNMQSETHSPQLAVGLVSECYKDNFLTYRDSPRLAAGSFKMDSAKPDKVGQITFASFNNLSKVTDEVIGAWSKILQQVPQAELLLKYRSFDDEKTCGRILDKFAEHGLAEPGQRVRLVGFLPHLDDHLALYCEVDIALDTFPYNGTTTTCEALWMSTPVISLAGDRHAARVGASLLGRLGLDDLLAQDHDDYVAKAVLLAADEKRRLSLQRQIRPAMEDSTLLNAALFCRQLEEVFSSWCGREGETN